MAPGVDTRAPYEQLFSLYLPIAAVVFVAAALVLLVVAMRFRARPGRRPSARTQAPRLELGYASALVLISIFLLWRSFAAMSSTSDPVAARVATVAGASSPPGPGDLAIAVVASRWNWRALYPGGVVQTGDGHARPATLVVPADRPVRFRLTSRDVVHALWIPALRAKYDAMPRYVNSFELRFAAGLDYSTARCSEFCGDFHDQMRLRVQVRLPQDFGTWLRTRQQRLRRR
ncbi:MAG: cytochrome c oxidase subunit [Solirubrobacteraceae bacterium]|nr:cytochrome c oxidase subunit [Solirubrobacteraceae bacterium]